MAFTIPENLHPDLMPLAWLIGTWRGKGRGEYPNVPGFQFAQEVSFNHDGRAFLNYFSRSWIIDENDEIIRPAASEVGFIATVARHYELGPIALSVIKRNVPVDATLICEGVSASQEELALR